MFDPPDDCPRTGALGERIRDPILEYANWSVKRQEAKVSAEPKGTACVGGFVYRGVAIPELEPGVRITSPSGNLSQNWLPR